MQKTSSVPDIEAVMSRRILFLSSFQYGNTPGTERPGHKNMR
jgi:hypothetical protein